MPDRAPNDKTMQINSCKWLNKTYIEANGEIGSVKMITIKDANQYTIANKIMCQAQKDCVTRCMLW
jgi:hypothetical protein